MVSRFVPVSSVKFEIYIPTTWVDRGDPAQTPRPIPMTEIIRYLDDMTAKYKRDGGYTISNPYGPPPFAGGYQGGPQERSYWAILIIPEHLLNQADQDVQEMVAFFQDKYQQLEILTHRYHVYRYMPVRPGQNP